MEEKQRESGRDSWQAQKEDGREGESGGSSDVIVEMLW